MSPVMSPSARFTRSWSPTPRRRRFWTRSIVAQAGIDPIHFGLVFVLSTMIGLITPPVGITMFIACQLAGITVNEFTRAVWRPFLALVLAVIVCALWPGLVLFLPNLVMGR